MDKSTRAICFVRGQEFLGWFKSSGEQITGTSPSDRIIVEHEDDSHSLVIRRLMLSDGGEYICRGSKTSATYSLYVECTYRILNPIISARLIYVESAISVSLFRDLKWGRGKGIIRKAFCAGLYLGSLSLVWRFSWAYIKIPHGNWPFKKLQRTNKRNEIHTRTASRNWTNCPSKKCSLWKTSHRFCQSTIKGNLQLRFCQRLRQPTFISSSFMALLPLFLCILRNILWWTKLSSNREKQKFTKIKTINR